ncbi:hypothetical protein C0585_01035 [Candidatus Woesearchaeota archaeon]|uniref:hypothetical protein n=1 Tax=uncultured Arcobacter sp. TaxID=165434 RepID=UPI000CC60F47|nr:hypothetical protein [uncultured Arcobacter sp.]PLW80768.1 MAG: hypothetical protein C0585_01035 [Candidatus Woesearchaeota archaeon]
MRARNFEEDLADSNNIELLKDWERYIRKIFGEDAIINWKENCMVSQKDFGSDVLVTDKKGRKNSIDVKTRRYDYLGNGNYILEIAHHIYTDETRTTKKETKAGWLYCSTSDIILFGTVNQEKTKLLEVCGFSIIPFKEEYFKSEISNLKSVWASTQYQNGNFQLTLNKLVDLDFLKNNAIKFWYFKE